MSKKFKSQASSSRAAAGGFGAFSGSFGGFSTGAFSQAAAPSSLTYVAEPPDLSRIAEPQLVVAFRNLLKRDDITKAKALEDLRDYILTVESRNGTLDDGFLEAWIKIYPRMSIDISRRVRQLAHLIQGNVASLAGKRIARHLSKVVGAWLAGLYDNDRPVLRSAQESFIRVFPTEEKRNSVWKIYQTSILEFVDDVTLQQTPLTLSDERTVKLDDAEAKYARVVATAILIFNRILGTSSPQDLQKDLPLIETLLSSKSLWAFSHHEDPFVRRATYNLLRAAISKEPQAIDWKITSTAVIGKSLSIAQIGSASDLSEALLQLTQSRPTIWTEDYSGKSPASKRLRQYIQKGSQGASSSYWSNLNQLLRIVPIEVLARDTTQITAAGGISLSEATSLMEAFQDGLNSREEPRQNLMTGWKSYIETGNWLLTLIPEEDREKFIQTQMSPLIEQYVLMNKDQPRWTLPAADAETLCRDCFISLAEHGHEATLQSLWMILTDKLLEAVKLSSPEQSRDFKASQDSICTQANRLFTLQTAVIRRLSGSDIEPRVKEIFEKPGLPLLENSLHVLRSRNGKPYGAAAVVEEAIRNIPQVAKCSTGLAAFVRDDIPDLLFSPSADRLMAIMLECRRWAGFESSFEKSVEKVVETEAEELTVPFLEKLLSTIDFKEVKDISGLESKIMQSLKKACRGSRLHWPIIAAVVGNPTSHGELSDRIFLSLVDSLSEDETSLEALHGLSLIVSRGQTALQRFRNGDHGSKLLAKLLYLTESPSDEIAHLAESLEKKIKSMIAKDTSARSNLEILQHSFSEVSVESLSVESLINIAEDLLRNAAPEEKPQVAASIFPSQESWKSALEPFLGLPPRASTAITGVLGGFVYLVDRDLSGSSRQKLESVPRDSDRCSSAFRLTSYVTKILSSSKIVEFLRPEERNTLFYYLPLAIQLIDDDLSIEGCNGITGLEMPEEREEYLESVSQGRTLVNNWIRSESPLDSENGASLGATMATFWEQKLEALEDTSPESYRVGEAFVRIMSERDSASTSKSTDFLTNLSKQIRTSNAIRSAAWIAVLRPSLVSIPAGTRLCNELISDATGLDPKKKQSEGLRKLSLLNLLAEGDDVVIASAQTQRLVFLVKHLIQCFQSGIESLNVKAEVIKLLSVILPKLAEIYGSHWADTMEILNSTWKETSGGDEGLSVLYASFRLFGRLRLMANGESNDDFEDAWSESKDDLVRNLVSTLSRIDSSTAFHQPRDVTADLLCRLITTIPVESLENVSEIFPLLTAQTRGIQRSAYEVLHRYIPKTQEQVSFDVALTKSTVRLPEELLSLLREAPTMESISSSHGEGKMWIRLRSYLLSWKVVFDHFSNASLTVQEDYASSIKENDILNPLLEFAFDFLQKSHGKLVDASKFDVRSFEPDTSDSSEKETQWLLVHLYFLSLKHLANLTKTWWIDSKKRIKGVVEMWTEKFISPLIIEDALKSVSEWTTTQDPDEERALSVKVSPKTAELVASIPVDEESPPVAISISLPPAYPLQPALVTGRSRVLVDEKKWRSWVLTIQGVIMFSNGNLVDGLLAFRRNVQGALRGQSECAICYSVISTDMQTPNKRCATCKNTFHSVCLFRWFKSSNQSTCPLCRNNFVYV